jgi:uncharacterized protein (TIGR01777 family)
MSPNKGPRRIAIAGASGFIGSALSRHLESLGHAVIRIGRREDPRHGNIRWDPDNGVLDASGLAGVRIVVNLCGEDMGRRWTPEVKKRIVDSRVRPTDLLARAIAQLDPQPKVLVNMSAIGLYGDRGDEEIDEDSTPGSGFLADVVRAWEAAAEPARAAGIRVVHPRTVPVLHPAGGMLKKLLPVFRLGLGGVIGDGRQWLSWISRTDAIRALSWAALDDSLSGPLLVASPTPVRSAQFMRSLAHALHRPALTVVPALAVRTVFGEMADETILSGQKVIPRQLQENLFQFDHPTLDQALEYELQHA